MKETLVCYGAYIKETLVYNDLFNIQLANSADNICPNRKRREEKREPHFYKDDFLCQNPFYSQENGSIKSFPIIEP